MKRVIFFLCIACITAAPAVGYFEEWTAAIKSGEREKIEEQLKEPRELLQKAKATAKELAIRLEPLANGLADRLLLDNPQSIRGANKLLTGFLQWSQGVLVKDQVLNLTDQWFKYRSSDEVTPVSGDARSLFTRVHNTFIEQQKDVYYIVSGAMGTFWLLAQMDDSDDPDVIRTAKRLALFFYKTVGERTGNTALEKTEQYLDEFLQKFKAVSGSS